MITLSNEGSLKLTSTGDSFVDQFASISKYRNPRPFSEIEKDMKILWDLDPLKAIRLSFYIRMITRETILLNGEKVSSIGQGLKYEGIMRMFWVAKNHSESFYKNLPLFITAGCWKDLFQLMIYDKDKVLNWNILIDFIIAGLENPNSCNLVKKYLPTIKTRVSTPKAYTKKLIGKLLVQKLFNGDYKSYRKLKSSGTAHQWQQQISKGNFNIDFNTVHGRALSLLVSGKYLENHNLTKVYEEWIESQPAVKFTGYVYELFKDLRYNTPRYKVLTMDKQFLKLVETSKIKTTFLVVRDTSGSMSANVPGLNISSNNIAKSIALYFSYLLDGPFSKGYIEFSTIAKWVAWKGNTPTEKYLNDSSEAYGVTDFLKVLDLFDSFLKQGVPINQFPKGLICISDGEFSAYGSIFETTFSAFKRKLLELGFPKDFVDEFKIVLWDIPNDFYERNPKPKFESFSNSPNLFYMGGFDPAGISFLFGTKKSTPKTAKELFEAAMNQDILNMLTL